MNEKYEKIINLPHHVSKTRPQMSISDRAAQFAPYSALSGYEDAVEETARLTYRRIELDEYEKEKINSDLTSLLASPNGRLIRLTYFCPDRYKNGGAYVSVTGELSYVNEVKRELVLIGGYRVIIDEISELKILENEE